MIYHLSENEFNYLLAFSTIPGLTADDPYDFQSIVATEDVLESLMDKKYLLSENKEVYMPDELNFFMDIIRDPYAVIRISGENKKMWGIFKEDAILLITANPAYQMMWIPFIHLFIGATASFMEPYLNSVTGQEYRADAAQIDALEEDLRERGYQMEYEASVYKGHSEAENRVFKVYSDSKKQILITSEGEGIRICEPCKADMVNALTGITAYLHSDSIKQWKQPEEELEE